MHISELRDEIPSEYFDYVLLCSKLNKYAYPRGKINQWLKNQDIIRVKKGLYLFGAKFRRHPYNIEILANLIYGPSAISLQTALSYYGLIPEAVHTITSITNKRNKKFHTPVGDFTYSYLHPRKYSVGITLHTLADKSASFLIASPEKALCDLILLESMPIIKLEDFLFENLRIDTNILKTLSLENLQQISNIYNNPRVNKFFQYFSKWILR